ncbi:MAG: glycosyl hydrolase family 8 [Stellaceae bacterium]
MRLLVSRFAVAAAALWLATAAVAAPAARDAEQWAVYRSRFVTDGGRVVDTGNKEVSHTEGQGWAMLFAENFGDRASFDRIWTWTRDSLQRHDCALFAWRWDPANPKDPVADKNDAADGDILIAWALTRAAWRWHDAHYRIAARRIILDIRRKLIHPMRGPMRGQLVLLPGEEGFTHKDGSTIVNPSYYIYPAFRDFARIAPSYEWYRLRRDGLRLLARAQFGKWDLTPDWLTIDKTGELTPASEYPPRFGFNAIRVPLYLMWARLATPRRLAAYLDFWGDFGDKPVPAWANVDDNKLAPYAGSTGMQAIVQLARSYRERNPAPLPTIGDKDDYYSASLTLLARMVRLETGR